jgi:hypothetical protein
MAPIDVEVGDDIAGSRASGDASLKVSRGQDVYRETRIAEKLDRELREADLSARGTKARRKASRSETDL